MDKDTFLTTTSKMSSTHTRFRTSSPHIIAQTPLLALGQPKFFSEQQKPNADGLWFMKISFLKSPLKNLFQNSTNLLGWFCNNIYWTPMWVLALSPSSVIFTVNGQTKRDSILRKDNASLKISFHILFKELFFLVYMSHSKVSSTGLATKTLSPICPPRKPHILGKRTCRRKNTPRLQ